MLAEIRMIELQDGTVELRGDMPLEDLMMIDEWLSDAIGPRGAGWDAIDGGWVLDRKQDAVNLLMVWD